MKMKMTQMEPDFGGPPLQLHELLKFLFKVAIVIGLIMSTSILLLVTFKPDEIDSNSPWISTEFSVLSIAICLVGIYGSFDSEDSADSRRNALILFIVLAIFNLSILTFLLCTGQYGASDSSLEDSEQSYWDELRNSMALYDWYHAESGSRRAEVTRRWDSIQRNLKCCGVFGSHDWDKFRPKFYHSYYPDSCSDFGSGHITKDIEITIKSIQVGKYGKNPVESSLSDIFHQVGCIYRDTAGSYRLGEREKLHDQLSLLYSPVLYFVLWLILIALAVQVLPKN